MTLRQAIFEFGERRETVYGTCWDLFGERYQVRHDWGVRGRALMEAAANEQPPFSLRDGTRKVPKRNGAP